MVMAMAELGNDDHGDGNSDGNGDDGGNGEGDIGDSACDGDDKIENEWLPR